MVVLKPKDPAKDFINTIILRCRNQQTGFYNNAGPYSMRFSTTGGTDVNIGYMGNYSKYLNPKEGTLRVDHIINGTKQKFAYYSVWVRSLKGFTKFVYSTNAQGTEYTSFAAYYGNELVGRFRSTDFIDHPKNHIMYEIESPDGLRFSGFDAKKNKDSKVYSFEMHSNEDHNPRDGGWSDWNSITACNPNTGTTQLERDCTNPTPINGGGDCVGESRKIETCAVNGGLGDWSKWSECDDLLKTQSRTRKCDNPTAKNEGADCSESDLTETQSCTDSWLSNDTLLMLLTIIALIIISVVLFKLSSDSKQSVPELTPDSTSKLIPEALSTLSDEGV